MPTLAKESESPPDADAVLVLWRVSMECFIAVSGRRKAMMFLRLMTDKLASEERLAAVIPIRAGVEDVSARRARARAMEAWRCLLPLFLARVPPE